MPLFTNNINYFSLLCFRYFFISFNDFDSFFGFLRISHCLVQPRLILILTFFTWTQYFFPNDIGVIFFVALALMFLSYNKKHHFSVFNLWSKAQHTINYYGKNYNKKKKLKTNRKEKCMLLWNIFASSNPFHRRVNSRSHVWVFFYRSCLVFPIAFHN